MKSPFRKIITLIIRSLSLSALLITTIHHRASWSQSSQEEQHYRPAVLKLIYTINKESQNDSFLDTILIPVDGEPKARRIKINPKEFGTTLSQFYSQVASLRRINTTNKNSPPRRLHDILIGPLSDDIRDRRITTLLISANTGLQAVPFAALHDGKEWFGTRYAFSLTPSLSLMAQATPQPSSGKKALLAGASSFDGLAPLPMVNQEIEQIARIRAGNTYLNDQFTRHILDSISNKPEIDLIHLSTHAEFLPGGPQKSKIYLGKGSLNVKEFSELRLAREDNPFELFTLSACRTALGDRESELGLAGLALQAGARTAIGSLWYVDDLATTIYFIRFYRLLDQGLPKGEAMRQVRLEFSKNQFELRGQTVYDKNDMIIIDNLTSSQQRKFKQRLDHPFFWAPPIMLGLPW